MKLIANAKFFSLSKHIQNDSLKASIVELYNVHLLRLTNVQLLGAEVSALYLKQKVSSDKYVEP